MSATNAGALDLLAGFADIVGVDDPDAVAAWQDLAGLLELEGVLDDLSDNDARHVVAVTAYVLHDKDPAELRNHATWVRTIPEKAEPLDQPEECAVALEQIADLVSMPMGGPRP